MNNYIHVLDADGQRITSIVDSNLFPLGEEALRKQAQEQFPDAAQYIYGGDDMLDEFLAGKLYKNGVFEDKPVEKLSEEEIVEQQLDGADAPVDTDALLDLVMQQQDQIEELRQLVQGGNQ